MASHVPVQAASWLAQMRMPSKNAVSQSDEQRDLLEADGLFLEAIAAGQIETVNTMLDGGQLVCGTPQMRTGCPVGVRLELRVARSRARASNLPLTSRASLSSPCRR